MRTFDITPDGKHIVFDRICDNSDIVLIARRDGLSPRSNEVEPFLRTVFGLWFGILCCVA